MDKDKGNHNCDSSEDELAETWKHAKRTRMEKGRPSAPSMKRPLVGSPFPSTSGRAVPGSSRTLRPPALLGKAAKNSWTSNPKDSSTRSKGRPTGSVRPCDKRSQTENWTKTQAPQPEPRQPPENLANKRPHTTTPFKSTAYAEMRAKRTNLYIEKLITARSVGHYEYLSDIDLMQCKKLDEMLDNDLWSEWVWDYGRLLCEGETRRKVKAGSPVTGRSAARAEIDASSQPAWLDRPSTSRPPSCSTSGHLVKSQPGLSTSLPAASKRPLHLSDTPLTTDQVELLVQCDHPLASDPAAMSVADPRDTSDGPDDSACHVSFAEDSPVTRASKQYVDSGFITHLVGTLNRIAPEPLNSSPEPANVPSSPMENVIVLDVSIDETRDGGEAQPHDVTTESLQPGEDALQENHSRQEQEPIQPSASQESLTNAPAELDTSVSKENLNEGLNKAILSLLECPVCMEVMAPPLAQCRRGHLLCEGCRKLITSCPTCRSRFTASRNLAMEKVAEKLLYPCRHAGCVAVLPFKQRGQHEASCGRRSYLCSIPHCKERAHLQYDQLLQHHQTHHADVLLWGSLNNFEIDIVNESLQDDWLVRAHGELFHIHFCVDTDNWGINSSVTYIGPKKNAHNFIYKMSVEDNSQYNRKFSYQRTTHSDMESRAMNYARRDAFFIPLDGALFLARKKKLDNNKFSNFLCVTLNIKCKNRANECEVNEDIANGNLE